jgi:hypothetical protein
MAEPKGEMKATAPASGKRGLKAMAFFASIHVLPETSHLARFFVSWMGGR